MMFVAQMISNLVEIMRKAWWLYPENMSTKERKKFLRAQLAHTFKYSGKETSTKYYKRNFSNYTSG